ncbi:MAG: ligase-associated DNA damage response endonuclease PdeM [Gammaproteobacteria bacterium]|nr:ligase-associated DNA damage response endonuclease PdeM [Gammaproteobacteria bacterium]
MSAFTLELAGHRLTLLPQRGLWWSAQKTLILADLHLGKAAILRRAGIPVPEGSDALTLQRIDQLIEQLSPHRLLLLGDVIHGSIKTHSELIMALSTWRSTHAGLLIEAIVGNHDRHHTVLDAVIDWRAPQTREEGLIFCHEPPTETLNAPWLGGHWHPMARIRAGIDTLRLPIFSLEPTQGLVLPAFGEFTGGMDLSYSSGRKRFAVADEQIIAID